MLFEEIEDARGPLKAVIRLTPVLYSHTFSQRTGTAVFLKAESIQRAGSFKIRGAYTKIRTLPEEVPGVVCVSAGNHAQGVALAAKIARLKAHVVMPQDAPLNKVERTRGYGAEVTLIGRSMEEAQATAVRIAEETGYAFIHPFNDRAVVAGQGTLGLELMEQLPDISAVLVPVGGGGLIAGSAVAIKHLAPQVRVIGVQAEGASAAFRSYHKGELVDVSEPHTLADGIRIGRSSQLTLDLMKKHVDDIVTVSDEEITDAMVQIMDRSKLVVEAAGAVGVAALISGRLSLRGKVCVVLSGGNIDLNLIARVVERGLTRAGRYTVIQVMVSDRPGSLFRVLRPLSELDANVLDIKHHRAGFTIPVGMVRIDLLVETRDRGHAEKLVAALVECGLNAELADTA